jgi:hypothetical protein
VGSACRRERERDAGLGWLGASWAGCLPGSAQLGIQASSFIFYFFLLLLFLFYSEISFCVLKSFSYSNLIEIGADHIGSFKSVFRN